MSREDRDSTMLALKLEIQELRREVVELRQQKSSIPDPLGCNHTRYKITYKWHYSRNRHADACEMQNALCRFSATGAPL